MHDALKMATNHPAVVKNIVLELLSGESVLGFYQASKSYYTSMIPQRQDYIDDIMIGVYHNGGGSKGEFTIEWTILADRPVARLKIYDDGWHLLPIMPELIKLLANNSKSVSEPSITADEFARELALFGYRDLTRYTREHSGRFVKITKTALIPHTWAKILDLPPEFTHYTSNASSRELEGWAKPSRYLEMQGVIFTTNEDDATLLHLHLA